jgi:hypothetical protein
MTADAANKLAKKHRARMVALLFMVSLHDTQNRMPRFKAHPWQQAYITNPAGYSHAVLRQSVRFGVISLRLLWRA